MDIRRAALTIFLLSSSAIASAAPFCVVNASGKSCYYYSRNQCESAAQSQNGMCVVNDDEQSTQRPSQSSSAPFCLVTSYGSQCFYYDANSCRRAAESQDGACIANPNR